VLKNSVQPPFSISGSSTPCVKDGFLPTTSPPKAVFGGDKREGAGVENYFFNSLLGVTPAVTPAFVTGPSRLLMFSSKTA
jgi:hypothetical protein